MKLHQACLSSFPSVPSAISLVPPYLPTRKKNCQIQNWQYVPLESGSSETIMLKTFTLWVMGQEVHWHKGDGDVKTLKSAGWHRAGQGTGGRWFLQGDVVQTRRDSTSVQGACYTCLVSQNEHCWLCPQLLCAKKRLNPHSHQCMHRQTLAEMPLPQALVFPDSALSPLTLSLFVTSL